MAHATMGSKEVGKPGGQAVQSKSDMPHVPTEQRWSSRLPQVLDVAFYRKGVAPLHVMSRDISLGGMFVETVPTEVEIDTPVIVGFTLRTGERVSHHRLPASIVRVAKDGVGLMYQRFESDTVRVMREMLYGNGGQHGKP